MSSHTHNPSTRSSPQHLCRYQGEIGFFDFYIIPLAKKLKECGVFGVSSDEYLSYAETNRKEWQAKGQEVVASYVEKYGRKQPTTGSSGDGVSTTTTTSALPQRLVAGLDVLTMSDSEDEEESSSSSGVGSDDDDEFAIPRHSMASVQE